MKKTTGLKRMVKFFSVDFNPIDTNNISDIHIYLMKGKLYKIIFGFIGLLTGIASKSNHTKCASLSNKKCMTQPIFINLVPIKYSQEFHYYSFAIKQDRCVASSNTQDDLSNKACVPHKTEDLNLNIFNMI